MQLDYDEEVSFRALEALRDFARGDDPFFLCASYTHPHEPFHITREWWDHYGHDGIDMPAVGAKPIEEMHPYNQWLQIHHMVVVYEPDEASLRNARHAFYASPGRAGRQGCPGHHPGRRQLRTRGGGGMIMDDND